jgi:hypothetical protein
MDSATIQQQTEQYLASGNAITIVPTNLFLGTANTIYSEDWLTNQEEDHIIEYEMQQLDELLAQFGLNDSSTKGLHMKEGFLAA